MQMSMIVIKLIIEGIETSFEYVTAHLDVQANRSDEADSADSADWADRGDWADQCWSSLPTGPQALTKSVSGMQMSMMVIKLIIEGIETSFKYITAHLDVQADRSDEADWAYWAELIKLINAGQADQAHLCGRGQ